MCARKYPVAPPIKMNTVKWKEYMESDKYCAFYRVRFTNLRTKLHNHYLSGYKYIYKKGMDLDNGRIISAEVLELWLTDVDLQETLDSYAYDEMEVLEMYISKADYLPKKFIEYVLELFENKTKLDGIAGFEDIYLQSKQFVNALFGMQLTDIIQPNVLFKQYGVFENNEKWKREYPDIDAVIEDKRKKWFNNFNSYFQGIWVVAYARQNLWTAVKALDTDVIYYDTDSVKYVGSHDEFFVKYNQQAFSKLENVLLKLGIDVEKARPTNPKGKVKTLGEFKYEGTYIKFRTLGAKRYVYLSLDEVEDGVFEERLHMTVAGVNKETGVTAIKDISEFRDDLVFTHAQCGRFQLYYNDEQPTVVWNKGSYDEYTSTYKSGVCFVPSKYRMSIKDDYLDLISTAVKGIY